MRTTDHFISKIVQVALTMAQLGKSTAEGVILSRVSVFAINGELTPDEAQALCARVLQVLKNHGGARFLFRLPPILLPEKLWAMRN